MVEVEVVRRVKVPVIYLEAHCGVRYWEDGKVNGEPDEDGSRIPCRQGGDWAPIIDLASGTVMGWPAGTVADLHYKVCDDGMYRLLDGDHNEVRRISGYVPKIMCPGDDGYGDYVIMKIDGDGKIENWAIDLDAFEKDES
jgi:hypothetical protein